MQTLHPRDERAHAIDWLRRLRNYAVAIMARQFQDITGKIDNACLRKIFRQPSHLDVPDLADDDREITGRDEPSQLFMRMPDQRTGSIENLKSALAPHRAFCIRRAMRGDHDTSSG